MWQQFHVAPAVSQQVSAVSTPLRQGSKCTMKIDSRSFRVTFDLSTMGLPKNTAAKVRNMSGAMLQPVSAVSTPLQQISKCAMKINSRSFMVACN